MSTMSPETAQRHYEATSALMRRFSAAAAIKLGKALEDRKTPEETAADNQIVEEMMQSILEGLSEAEKAEILAPFEDDEVVSHSISVAYQPVVEKCLIELFPALAELDSEATVADWVAKAVEMSDDVSWSRVTGLEPSDKEFALSFCAQEIADGGVFSVRQRFLYRGSWYALRIAGDSVFAESEHVEISYPPVPGYSPDL